MAAPMSSESDTSDTGDIPEYLDPRSPKFDPKRALYEKSVPSSLTTAKQFNNLVEFENFLKGKDAKTQKIEKAKRESESMSLESVRAVAKATESERKAAILGKTSVPNKGAPLPERKKRQVTSVFTKMQGKSKTIF